MSREQYCKRLGYVHLPIYQDPIRLLFLSLVPHTHPVQNGGGPYH